MSSVVSSHRYVLQELKWQLLTFWGTPACRNILSWWCITVVKVFILLGAFRSCCVSSRGRPEFSCQSNTASRTVSFPLNLHPLLMRIVSVDQTLFTHGQQRSNLSRWQVKCNVNQPQSLTILDYYVKKCVILLMMDLILDSLAFCCVQWLFIIWPHA